MIKKLSWFHFFQWIGIGVAIFFCSLGLIFSNVNYMTTMLTSRSSFATMNVISVNSTNNFTSISNLNKFSSQDKTLTKKLKSLEIIVSSNKTIITFGDSLTAGLHLYSITNFKNWYHHPYSIQLQKLLGNVQLKTQGYSGWKTYELIPKLLDDLNIISNFTVVIILAGTNDLVVGKSAISIIENTIKLHQISHNFTNNNQSIYTLALTIPPLLWNVNQTARIEANQGLRDYVNKCNHRVGLIDLEDIFTPRQNNSIVDDYWCDGAHFTPLGYDMIGKIIYQGFKNISFHESDYYKFDC